MRVEEQTISKHRFAPEEVNILGYAKKWTCVFCKSVLSKVYFGPFMVSINFKGIGVCDAGREERTEYVKIDEIGTLIISGNEIMGDCFISLWDKASFKAYCFLWKLRRKKMTGGHANE